MESLALAIFIAWIWMAFSVVIAIVALILVGRTIAFLCPGRWRVDPKLERST